MKHIAIRNTHSSVTGIDGDDNAFDTNGNPVVLDQALVDAEVTRLQAEYDAQQYSRSRVTKYPAIGDQLDALFHAGVFPAEMAAEIQAVKDKYPK